MPIDKNTFICPKCFSTIIVNEELGFLMCFKCNIYFKSETDKAQTDNYKNPKLSPLSAAQETDLCQVIDEWYKKWKDKLVNYECRTHKLAYAKSDLKDILLKRNNTKLYLKEQKK